MASTVHTDATIFDGDFDVAVKAQFAGTDEVPEAIWLYMPGTSEEVPGAVYDEMSAEDWEEVERQIWVQWH